jgi:thiosulfate dehydrogenase
MSKWIALAVPLAVFMTHPAALAAPPPAAATCAACHGAHGKGRGANPRLAGQPAAYLVHQLADFKSGARQSRIMGPLAAGLSGKQIQALSDYYSHAGAAFPDRANVAARTLARGRHLARLGNWTDGVPACASCHGPTFEGLEPDFPALAGQNAGYIASQLAAYKKGTRANDPLGLMRHVAAGLGSADQSAVAAYLAWLRPGADNKVPAARARSNRGRKQNSGFRPPPESAIPDGPDGDTIRLGKQVFTQTPRYAKPYAGNALTCANCHLDRGRLADSAPMWAAFGRYPRYRKKNDKVNTLADRIQGCFVFSMNGNPPPAGSRTMVALESYFHWLATGAPVNQTMPGAGYPKLASPPKKPDPERGAAVFKTHCALCHGANGAGRMSAGRYVFPPLWGSKSFNWGAGMHRLPTAAAFIEANMPFGLGGTLSRQQAWDVAAFVDHHVRPEDPRFTGSVSETKARYHQHMGYYGDIDSHHEKETTSCNQQSRHCSH